jgi:hypothetical protein
MFVLRLGGQSYSYSYILSNGNQMTNILLGVTSTFVHSEKVVVKRLNKE